MRHDTPFLAMVYCATPKQSMHVLTQAKPYLDTFFSFDSVVANSLLHLLPWRALVPPLVTLRGLVRDVLDLNFD